MTYLKYIHEKGKEIHICYYHFKEIWLLNYKGRYTYTLECGSNLVTGQKVTSKENYADVIFIPITRDSLHANSPFTVHSTKI